MNERTPTGEVEPRVLWRMRRYMLVLVTLGTVLFLLELVLLEHSESALQGAPMAILGFGLVAEVVALLRPRRSVLRLIQMVMSLFVVFGAVGLYLHVRGNLLFELEMEPDAGGVALLWRTVTGGVPTLAPAGLVGLGLLGWIYTFRHPALAADEHV